MLRLLLEDRKEDNQAKFSMIRVQADDLYLRFKHAVDICNADPHIAFLDQVMPLLNKINDFECWELTRLRNDYTCKGVTAI